MALGTTLILTVSFDYHLSWPVVTFIVPGCSRNPEKRMQVSWCYRGLQFENLLETTGPLQCGWIRTETEIPRSCQSIILEQRASPRQQPRQTGD